MHCVVIDVRGHTVVITITFATTRTYASASPPRFLNRDDLDFAAVEQLAPVQEWDLQREDPQGVLEYPTQ
jgi:hypothetical protein